jgi:serine/threonine protein kinase
LTSKIDIWSLGCCLYELLTSEILFNSDKYNYHKNKYHLSDIYEKCGKIPDDMILQSSKKELYFSNELKIKNISCLDFDNTWNVFFDNLMTTNIKKNLIFKILFNMITTSPSQRSNADQLLTYFEDIPIQHF